MKKFANILKQIPMNPGIYMYRNSDDIVIYVGKAKNLFNRVNSYFTGKKDPKTEALVKKIAKIDFFVTENETEALRINFLQLYQNFRSYVLEKMKPIAKEMGYTELFQLFELSILIIKR